MKLKDVYIAWDKSKMVVKVVLKAKGKPCKDKDGRVKGYYDSSDWDLTEPTLFFLEQFTSLTYAGFNPKQVYHEFESIDEFEEVNDRCLDTCLPYRRRCAEMDAQERKERRRKRAA